MIGQVGRFTYGLLAKLVDCLGLRKLRIMKKLGIVLRFQIRRFLPEEVYVRVYGLTLTVPRDFAFLRDKTL